jgi:aspartyl/asparaginyl beta-hydroxylase (cupin superfamily)
VTVGGGLGLTGGNGDVLAYRNRLDQDQYLLVIKNLDPMQTRQANDLIRLQNPETVQGYTDSGAV